MTLYGNDCSDMDFHFTLKEVKLKKPPGVFPLIRDSEVDTPEYHSDGLLEPSNNIVLSLSRKFSVTNLLRTIQH